MPESPVSQKFSEAPEGKKALSAEEMKAAMAGKLQAAARAIGGRVIGEVGEIQEVEAVKDPGAASNPEVEKPTPTYDVSPDIRQHYIRSLLSKEPFIRSYELFGGKLQVAFRTMKSKEADAILRSEATDKLQQRLMTCLYTLDVGADLSKMQPKTLDDLDDVAVSAVYNAFKDFELLCDELYRRANDPDFWTRTAGRT